MLPVVRPSRLLLLTTVLALVVTAVSVTLRLVGLSVRPARSSAAGDSPEEPFPGFTLLLTQFTTDGETNLAVWFSSLLLVMTALTAAGIWRTLRRQGAPRRWHWLALSLLFFYVSLDEVAMLHEMTIPVMAEIVDADGVLTFAWVVLAAPLVVVLALTFLPWLWRLAHRTGLLLAVAGVVFVSGALGMELLGGWIIDGNGGPMSVAYVWTTTAEELLENLGAALALYAVTRHATLTLALRPDPGSAPEQQAAVAPRSPGDRTPDDRAPDDRTQLRRLAEPQATAR